MEKSNLSKGCCNGKCHEDSGNNNNNNKNVKKEKKKQKILKIIEVIQGLLGIIVDEILNDDNDNSFSN